MSEIPGFLNGGSDVGKLIAGRDWTTSPLGHPASWPTSLQNSVRIMLACSQPAWIGWGDELTLLYNDAFHSLLPPATDVLGTSAIDFWAGVSPIVQAIAMKSLTLDKDVVALDEQLSFHHEDQIHVYHFSITCSPLFHKTEHTAGVFCMMNNITDRVLRLKENNVNVRLEEKYASTSTEINPRNAERALLQSEARFRNILEQTPEPMVVFKGEDMIVDVANEPLLRTWRKDKSVIGKPLLECLPEVRGQGVIEMLLDVYHNRKIIKGNDRPVMYDRGNGVTEILYYNFVYTPYVEANGEVSGVLVIGTDVTSSVHARQKLEQSELRFRSLIEEAPIATGLFVGPDFRIEIANGKMSEYFHQQQPVTGRALAEISPTLNGESMVAILKNVILSGETYSAHAVPTLLPGGDQSQTLFYDYTFKPLYNEGGEVYGVITMAVDVTSQVLSLQKLQESERKFRHLIHANIVGVLFWDLDGGILDANDTALQMLGYTQSDLEAGLLDWRNLTPLQWNAIDALQERKIIETGKHEPYEKQFYHRDGHPVDVILAASAFEGTNNRRGVTFVIDNTIRKKTEDQLRLAKEQLDLTFRNIPVAVFLHKGDGTLLYLNDRAAQVIGHPSARDVIENTQFINLDRSIQERYILRDENGIDIKAEETPPVLAFTKKQHTTRTMQFVNRQSGEAIWFRVEASPLMDADSNLDFVLLTGTDLSAQKEAEHLIRQSETRFRILAETLPQMIWVTDDKGAYEYSSQNWFHYSGQTTMEAAWHYMIHPEDANAALQSYQEALTQQRPYRGEVRMRNAQGEYRWHSTVAEPVKDATGKIIKWIGALTDIHDQKTITEKLQHLVAERTQELEQINKALYRSNEDLQQFAHVASHDLKEPVRKIKTFVNRMKESQHVALAEPHQTFLSKIEHAANRIYAMIEGVLTYSYFNSPGEVNDTVDLALLLQQVTEDLDLAIEQKHARIEVISLPVVKGSHVLLYQLFYNLINNSLKFARPDLNPVIHIETNRPTAELSDVHTIVVKDNGIGFPQEYADKIFMTFTRLHPKDKYEGTGLGLALCKKIVERHGGTITAKGKENEGAEFRITLPLLVAN